MTATTASATAARNNPSSHLKIRFMGKLSGSRRFWGRLWAGFARRRIDRQPHRAAAAMPEQLRKAVEIRGRHHVRVNLIFNADADRPIPALVLQVHESCRADGKVQKVNPREFAAVDRGECPAAAG